MRFVILDANSIMHRSFHALPPLTTRSGELVNAVYGFASILMTILTQEKPDYIAAAFDTKAPTFRHEVYKEYKAGRVKPPQEFYDQIPRIEEVLRTMEIPMFRRDGVEADDIIGTVVKRNEHDNPDMQNKIVTSDRDALQLISDKTCVANLHKGYKSSECFWKDDVLKKYGITPEQVIDMKALEGDASDNIPGVKGIGKVGAVELLRQFGNLENIYSHINEIKGKKQQLLKDQKDSATLSKHLATIKTDVPIDLKLNDCKAHEFNTEAVVQLFESLQFYSLIRRLKEWKKGYGIRETDIVKIFSEQNPETKKEQTVLFT